MSVPYELNTDQALVLAHCAGAKVAATAVTGLHAHSASAVAPIHDASTAKEYTSVGELAISTGWALQRARTALESLLKEGMAWVDCQATEAGRKGRTRVILLGGDRRGGATGVTQPLSISVSIPMDDDTRFYFPAVSATMRVATSS
jgi:hypothetical protein